MMFLALFSYLCRIQYIYYNSGQNLLPSCVSMLGVDLVCCKSIYVPAMYTFLFANEFTVA